MMNIGGHTFEASTLTYVGPVEEDYPAGHFITVGLASGFHFLIKGTLQQVRKYRQQLAPHISSKGGDPRD